MFISLSLEHDCNTNDNAPQQISAVQFSYHMLFHIHIKMFSTINACNDFKYVLNATYFIRSFIIPHKIPMLICASNQIFIAHKNVNKMYRV